MFHVIRNVVSHKISSYKWLKNHETVYLLPSLADRKVPLFLPRSGLNSPHCLSLPLNDDDVIEVVGGIVVEPLAPIDGALVPAVVNFRLIGHDPPFIRAQTNFRSLFVICSLGLVGKKTLMILINEGSFREVQVNGKAWRINFPP